MFICATEEEAWEKEKEVIAYLDAANNKEYYNIAPGGPSKPDGLFLISDSERDKMDYLNAQLKNEEYCGVRLEERDYGKPRIIFIKTMMYHNQKHGKFTTVDDDTGKRMGNGKNNAISNMNKRVTMKPLNDQDNIPRWICNTGFTLVPKTVYDDYIEKLDYSDYYDVIVDMIKTGSQVDVVNPGLQNSVQKDTNPKKDVNTTTIKQKTTHMRVIDRLRECAKVSVDCLNFVNLVDKYNDLSFNVIYNAVTGGGAVSGNSFHPDDIKCTRTQKNQAAAILDYELNFTNMLQVIGGRQDYYYVVLAYCFRHNKIDNNELLKRFRKKYKSMKPAQSIEVALDEIEKIYNYKKPQQLKVAIKYEYLADKNK